MDDYVYEDWSDEDEFSNIVADGGAVVAEQLSAQLSAPEFQLDKYEDNIENPYEPQTGGEDAPILDLEFEDEPDDDIAREVIIGGSVNETADSLGAEQEYGGANEAEKAAIGGELMPDAATECSLAADSGNGVCMSPDIAVKLAEIVGGADDTQMSTVPTYEANLLPNVGGGAEESIEWDDDYLVFEDDEINENIKYGGNNESNKVIGNGDKIWTNSKPDNTRPKTKLAKDNGLAGPKPTAAELKAIVARAMSAVGCSTEKCLLSKRQVIDALGEDVVRRELATKYKIKGPTDITLINNFNIHEIMAQWAEKWSDFFVWPFAMRDFAAQRHTLDTMDVGELYATGFRTAACVINNDLSSGPGTHWMALFVDMRDASAMTVEYFNSSGNRPKPEFNKWLQKTASALGMAVKETQNNAAEAIVVTDKMHQHTQTECGVYALYYIWARLNGVPWTAFNGSRVPDEIMLEFRQHLFEGPYMKPGEQWSFDDYKGSVRIKWESGFNY
jgi:Ulp1 protease family, C-terminal catalytic domain